MHYVAVINGEEHEVEVVEVAPDRFHLFVDDKKLDADVTQVSETALSCIIDNQVFEIDVEQHAKTGENMLIGDHVVHMEVLDLRRMRLRQAKEASGGDTGPAEITSPMPGKVVAVLVKDGDEVTEGQGLLVVEAMKMENELKSPRDGLIQKLDVQEGTAIDGGAILCVVA